MAIHKSTRRNQTEGPDAAAFVRLIDEGLAEPKDVSAAYRQTLRMHAEGKTYTERPQEAEVVQERPVIDPEEPPTPAARMVELARRFTFKEGEGR